MLHRCLHSSPRYTTLSSISSEHSRPWTRCRAAAGAAAVAGASTMGNSNLAGREEDAAGAAQQRFPLLLLPLRQTKTLHFIRHGEGYHNVAGHINHDNYKSEEWFDAHLTEEGWRQSDALNRHIRAAGLKVDLVIVSPLMRALETAVGAFGSPEALPSAPPLMVPQTAVDGHRAARPAVAAEGAPPFLAHELCREIIGVHPCDRRRPTSTCRELFPGVDWSLVDVEQDVLWSSEHRETKQEISERARRFLEFVMQRPETSIAIVTHSTFLHYMCNSFGHDYSTHVQDELHRWYENCEMRSLVVADTKELHRRDSYHFHGGRAC